MKVPMADLQRLHQSIKDELEAAIEGVFGKSAFILGSETEAFETEFATYLGAKYAVGVGSGTDAIKIALMALGISEGDEVITTALSAYPTAEAILWTGAKPVFIDIDERTCNIDPSKVEEKITTRTKAVLPVHLYGAPANMTKIMEIARTHKLFVIEDCCQAHGARVSNAFVGTLGNVGCFSFYPSKNLGGIGDGGMIIATEEEIAKKARALRDHGRTGRDTHSVLGFNSRLDGIQSAVLRVKLRHLAAHNEMRAYGTAVYKQNILTEYLDLPASIPGNANHLFVIQVKENRDGLQKYLRQEGIETLVHYPIALHRQSAYKVDVALPVVERVVRKIVSLPLFPLMTAEERSHVICTVNQWKS